MGQRAVESGWGDAENSRIPWFAVGACVVAFVAAALFLRGDFGWWNDDFFFSLRDPATGRAQGWTATRTSPYFDDEGRLPVWRPIHHALTPALITGVWDMPWIAHVVQACAHGCTALTLAWLLRELGASGRARFAAVLLFLVWPSHFEAVFWAAALSTTIATGLALCAIAWCARTCRDDADWKSVAACVLCAAPVPLMNEQPAAMLGAMGAFAWVATRAGANAVGARRAWWCVAIVGVACVAWAAVLVAWPGQAGGIGAGGAAGPLWTWPRNILNALSDIGKQAVLLQYVGVGGFQAGLAEIAAHPARATVLAFAAVATGAPAWRWWVRVRPGHVADGASRAGSGARAEATSSGRGAARLAWRLSTRPHATLALGVAMMLASLVPIAVVGATVRPRMTYVVLAGLAVAIAGGIDWSRRALSHDARACARAARAGAVMLAALAVFGTVSMVGAAGAYAARTRLDGVIVARLRALPPLPPGAVLLVLRSEDLPLSTARWRFDSYFIGPLHTTWATPRFGQRALGRADVFASSMAGQGAMFADRVGIVPDAPVDPAVGERWSDPRLPDDIRGKSWPWQRKIAWDRVVPIAIERDGSVTLYTRLVIAGDGEWDFTPEFTLEPPIVAAWRATGRAEEREARIVVVGVVGVEEE
jgi:hypothetical protein